MVDKEIRIKYANIIEGKVIKLKVDYKGREYLASVTPNEIHIDREGAYNRKKKNMQWYFEHNCGLKGFGHSINDSCPACDSPEGITKSYKGVKLSGISNSILRPERLPIILDRVCLGLEKNHKKSLKSLELVF